MDSGSSFPLLPISTESQVNKYSSVKILVVDDQPAVVEELCEFLENSRYHCAPGRHG